MDKDLDNFFVRYTADAEQEKVDRTEVTTALLTEMLMSAIFESLGRR